MSLALRVLVVTHYWAPHVGGIESVAGDQVAHLARRGVAVEVRTTHIPRSAPREDLDAVPGARVPVRVERHAALDPLARTLQVPVPLPGPGMASAVVRAARRADVVVAHGHSYPTSALAAWAARRTRRPFVLVQHAPWVDYGPALSAIERAADRTIGRAVIRAARQVVCVSEHTATYVRSIVPDAPTTVARNGVDVGRFSPDGPVTPPVPHDAGGRAAPSPVVLFVGRLVRRNGWGVLLEAWERAGLHDRAELHLAGDGPDASAVRATVLPGVRVLGHVDEDDLPGRYRGAAAVVVPSVSGEGFGLVAAEALSSGTPVVASAQGGLTEVVRDGEDGLLVAPGDVAGLAEALVRIVEDRSLRSMLAAGARRRDLSVDRASDRLLDVLRSVVVGGPSEVRPVAGVASDATPGAG